MQLAAIGANAYALHSLSANRAPRAPEVDVRLLAVQRKGSVGRRSRASLEQSLAQDRSRTALDRSRSTLVPSGTLPTLAKPSMALSQTLSKTGPSRTLSKTWLSKTLGESKNPSADAKPRRRAPGILDVLMAYEAERDAKCLPPLEALPSEDAPSFLPQKASQGP